MTHPARSTDFNPCDPDGVLAHAVKGDVLRLEGWERLSWASMTDKRDAVRIYSSLGLNPILIHGLQDDGACTCGHSDCVKSRGKHPVFRNWQTAVLDVDAIDDALIRNWRFNIGLRTGKQPCGRALCVVDVDGPRSLLEPLEREHGAFPPTLTARTGSGGLHLFYWLRPGVQIGNRAGVVPQVDFRGFGGQVVAAPSLHLSGNRYEWITIMEPAVLP